MEYIIVFESTNKAIQAEQMLLTKSVDASVRPVPAVIKSGCGISLSVNDENLTKALDIGIEKYAEKIYKKIVTEGMTRYEQI